MHPLRWRQVFLGKNEERYDDVADDDDGDIGRKIIRPDLAQWRLAMGTHGHHLQIAVKHRARAALRA